MTIFILAGTAGVRFRALGILDLVIRHRGSIVEDLGHDIGGANDVDHPSS
jgi:hypothetical protein